MARTDLKLVVGGTPRAELLPPEIALEKKAAGQRRSLLGGLVVVIAVVVLAYAGATGLSQLSQARLDELNAQSADLLAQQSEFIEARQLAAQVSAANAAREIGIGPEIDWMKYLNLLASAASGTNVGVVTIKVTAETPIVPFAQSTVVFEKPRVAEVTFTGLAGSPAEVASWVTKMLAIEGVADASITSIEDVGGAFSYTVVIHLNSDAYSLRGAPDAATDAPADEPETPATPSPEVSSTPTPTNTEDAE